MRITTIVVLGWLWASAAWGLNPAGAGQTDQPAFAAAQTDAVQTETQLQLTLRVYNYAGAHDAVLRRAEREASRILNETGIESSWLDCPTSPEQMAANRACADPAGPNHLVLNLLPHSMSKQYPFRRGVYGFALPTANGRPGTHVCLFFKRVLDLAYHGGIGLDFENAQAVILGHMMAHEIGHLLLGPDSHGASGVMSFPWNARTLTNMERGLLEFTPTERSRIRKELNRRTGLAQRLGDGASSATRFRCR